MAECAEVLYEASREEQQEEITALQSIFEDDLQMIEGGDGKVNICFNLTVKVNIPHDVIDFEAFIPVVEVFEDLPRRTSSSGSHSDSELGNDSREDKENGTLSDDNLFNDSNLDVRENRVEASSAGVEVNNGYTPRPGPSPDSLSRRSKPGFARSISLQHWHVKADIQHLTPIHMTCSFPPLYPTECPPEFSLACLWLTQSQIQELQDKLMELWTETPNLPMVFTWADWLQNYAYKYLCLDSHLVLKESEAMPQPSEDDAANSWEFKKSEKFNTKLETALLTIFEHDLEMQRQTFRQGKHLCEICFDEREGVEFHYLDECKHFFCTECLRAHCELHVESGTVLNLLCPSHDCKTTIPPEILQEVLDTEKLERWERLLLSKTLDVMGDVVFCPRCNVAVVVDEDESSKLGHCANCYFAFCTECYEPWHHGQPCFADELDSGEEGKGKSSIKSKKAKGRKGEGNEEDQGGRLSAITLRRQQRMQREKERKIVMSNLSFIRMMKQKGAYQYCPKCRMAVERISGCDMMHCSQCRASFCWRCGKAILGYDHFGNCNRDEVRTRVTPRGPTLGETMIEEYQKANPKKALRTKLCPRCHQKCLKENSNNNHLKCWACKTPFCYQCGKEIKGTVTMHFTATSSCMQHSDD